LNVSATLPFNTAGHNSRPFGRRQREPRGARRPVVLVTGFHGAGKTRLIDRLLGAAVERPLIINEAGEGEPGGEMPAGCLCCPARGEIERVLAGLVQDHAAGKLPGFARILIETAGGADPSALMKALLDERNLGRHFHLASVVAVVDAASGARTLETSPAAQRQIAVADRIVIAGSDLADEHALAELRRLVTALNATAPQIAADDPALDAGFLLRDGSLPFPRLEGPTLCEPAAEAHRSFRLTFERALPWDTLSIALGLLRDMRGADLLRVKGLVAIAGCAGPVVIHIVQNVAQKPIELERWPDGDRVSQLVFITRGLARERVAALFDAISGLRDGEAIHDDHVIPKA
jgi:G3E family GTPase